MLDTGTVSVFFYPDEARHAAVRRHMNANTGYIFVPAIAAAEIEFGFATVRPPLSAKAQAERVAIRKFLSEQHKLYEFDKDTVEPYALIRAELWRQTATPKGRGYKEKHPYELKDRVTEDDLGIDEKDLMIAAMAVQHGCMLATVDLNVRMERIKAACDALEAAGEPVKLKVVDWSA